MRGDGDTGLSGTAALVEEAAALRREGVEILDLGAGDPDHGPPEQVLDAVRAALGAGRVPYTEPAGLLELREAVAAHEGRRGGVRVSPRQVVATTGGKQALALLVRLVLGPGDEALVPAPYWPSFPAMVRLAGAAPRFVPCPEPERDHLQAEAVAEAWSERTRLLILNSPCNPTGAVLSQEEMDRLVEAVLERGGAVLSDETYAGIVYDGRRAGTALPWIERAPERVAVVGSVSKTWAMTGFRLGWAVVSEGLARRLAGLVSHHTSCPPYLAQRAALAALTGPQEPVRLRVEEYETRRGALAAALAGCPGVRLEPPEGALYLFPRLGRDGTEVAGELLRRHRVAVVPGEVFGEPRALRLSLTAPPAVLEEAAARLRSVLER